MNIKRFVFILLIIFSYTLSYAQEERKFVGQIKLGAAFGGSKPSTYNNTNQANLMINVMAALGVSYYFKQNWELYNELQYIRKGSNCSLNSEKELIPKYPELFTQDQENKIFGWFDNGYIEIPLTIGYLWGYGSFITRVGGYFAYKINTKADVIINNNLVSKNYEKIDKETFNPWLSKYDIGFKILNEFYFNNFGVGLEFSTGFIPIIKKQWQYNNIKSYNMAVAFFLSYSF